jgi:WD40 repeat protein
MDPAFIQSAGDKCTQAFNAPLAGGQLQKAVLTLIDRGYGWTSSKVKTPFAEARIASEVKTLVCIRETTNAVGSYSDGESALKYRWEIRMLDLESGKVIAQREMLGGDPPQAKIGSGPGYGSQPRQADYAAWALKLLDIPLFTHSAGVINLAFSPNGKTLAAGTSFVEAKLWDLASGQATLLNSYQEHLISDAAVTFSPDGNWLGFTGMNAPTFKKYGGSQGVPNLSNVNLSSTYLLAFSPDGQSLAVGGSVFGTGMPSGKVYVIDFQTGAVKAEFSRELIDNIAFSPDGSLLAAHGAGSLSVWSVSNGQKIFSFSTGVEPGDIMNTTAGKGVSFSPDGKYLAAGSKTGIVYLWKTDDWSVAYQLEGHQKQSVAVAFSPDGRLLASGGVDDTILLWNVETGSLVDTLLGHTGTVSALAFSPDGMTLASGSADSTVFLWDMLAYR